MMINFINAKHLLITDNKDVFPSKIKYDFVFLGRSNVGKSSVINTLTNHKNLAFSSKKAGKTRAIHFFEIDEKIYFVDVPGYGFANINDMQKISFAKMMDEYFQFRKQISCVFVLIDSKVGLTSNDLEMIHYLKHLHLTYKLIINKIDKVNQSQKYQTLKKIKQELNLNEEDLILFSSYKKIGIEKVYSTITNFLIKKL